MVQAQSPSQLKTGNYSDVTEALIDAGVIKPPLKLATLSDIHLGHRRTRTLEITTNLKCAVADNPETAQLDIIFLAGDVFDTLLNLPHEDIVEIDRWILYLLRLCKKYDIKLRILEGTPSHDWEQSQRFIDMDAQHQVGCDVRYIKGMDIEYMPEFERHILYIQDQYAATTEKTLEDARALMAARGITYVDIAIMHGQFDRQVPPQADCPKHDSDAYLGMVRELICIGHDHHYWTYDKIVAQGSFDRLAHNEEEPKGHIRAFLRGDGTREVRFVENTGAKKFVSVDCQGLDVETSLAKINTQIADLPDDSYVRLILELGHHLLQQPSVLIRTWPQFRWSKPKIVKPDDKKKEDEQAASVPAFQAITLTRDNLPKLLLERIGMSAPDDRVMEQAALILEELL
jgi:DNA repair exonuclease SbcCD nuclease subunit